MINNASVRRMYSKLVPADVSHKLFWARYFYKVRYMEKYREFMIEKLRVFQLVVFLQDPILSI